MPAETTEFDSLIDRFKQLSEVDQAAVLAHLPEDEREQTLAAMTGRELARRAEVAAAGLSDRRYAAYSPWLAQMVRAAEAGTSEGVTANSAKALSEGHRLLAAEAAEFAPGLLGQARNWFDRVTSGLGGAR
jgi:hypothetical protein